MHMQGHILHGPAKIAVTIATAKALVPRLFPENITGCLHLQEFTVVMTRLQVDLNSKERAEKEQVRMLRVYYRCVICGLLMCAS